MSAENTTTVPEAGRTKETWVHQGEGRWVQRVVHSWSGGAYVATGTNRFVWDDKVLIAILDHTNGVLISFQRGLDLGGSFQGAGGTGGLLAVNNRTNGLHFVAFDGNGNVMGLVAGPDGGGSGKYEYEPFGKAARVTGAAGKGNPMRFSTQWGGEAAGWLIYAYRDYTASGGRWLSRDLIQETGGLNLYGAVFNDPINNVDYYGLTAYSDCWITPEKFYCGHLSGLSYWCCRRGVRSLLNAGGFGGRLGRCVFSKKRCELCCDETYEADAEKYEACLHYCVLEEKRCVAGIGRR